MNFICPTCKRPTQLDNEMIEYLVKEKDKYRDMLGERTKELERTRKALDVAKDTFNWIDETYRTGQETEAEIWGKVQLAAQKITALEKSELENLEMLVNNVFK